MSKIFENLPDIIKQSATSTLGILALMIVALAILAFFFFKGAEERTRLLIFVMLFIGVSSFGAVITQQARTPPQPSPSNPKTPEGGQQADTAPIIVPDNFQNPIQVTPIFSESFDDYAVDGNILGSTRFQWETGRLVNAFGTLSRWEKLPQETLDRPQGKGRYNNGVHAVSRSDGNIAVQIFGGAQEPREDILTLKEGIDANTKGITYRVDYELAPTVGAFEQVTTANDGIMFEIFNRNGTILTTDIGKPGKWTKDASFTGKTFNYIGDGAGPIRIRIKPAVTISSADPIRGAAGAFVGAIDHLKISEVPRL